MTLLGHVLGFLFGKVRFEAGAQTGLRVSYISGLSRDTIDQRLSKIDDAKHSLTDALGALSELKLQAEANKSRYDALVVKLSNAQKEEASAQEQLQVLKDLAVLDSRMVRNALGIPSPAQQWRERGVSFALGVVASIVAAVIWHFAAKLF
jgi:hypothetical protein